MREFIDGATAIARAAIDAGCAFFAGYPISPATPLLTHMIRELPRAGGTAVQAEDEIGAISMCIGAAVTGARTLTATSGPGLSLYSENIGLAIMGEVPLVVVDVQRMGPATGGATTTAQGDVQFARWGTSGGYPVIALAPSSVPECYTLTLRAFELAERFRVPVFLLTDKELFLSTSTVELSAYEPAQPEAPDDVTGFAVRITDSVETRIGEGDGLPDPFPVLGGEQIVRFTGSTHDEHGMLTKDPAAVSRLNTHLWHKVQDRVDEITSIRADLAPSAQTLFISYGITARAMAEAARECRAQGRPISYISVQSLWPVPEDALVASLSHAQVAASLRRVVVAELNHGDYRREVERLIRRLPTRNGWGVPDVIGLNRVDGELITPSQFMEWV